MRRERLNNLVTEVHIALAVFFNKKFPMESGPVAELFQSNSNIFNTSFSDISNMYNFFSVLNSKGGKGR